jgi:hypothetical protein
MTLLPFWPVIALSAFLENQIPSINISRRQIIIELDEQDRRLGSFCRSARRSARVRTGRFF